MSPRNDRVATVANDVMDAIKESLTRNNVTHEEYRAAWAYLMGLADSGEMPLFLDVFFEASVEQNANKGKAGSEGTLLGPFYLDDAPKLERPYVITMRDDEPGDPMILVGTVVDLQGTPLPDARVDLWHSSNDGTYSGFIGDVARDNLRGVMTTDAEGQFMVRTIQPVPYTIPHEGPTGQFLEMLGREPWRPAHFHLIIAHEGFEPLITQLYFRGGEWLDQDVVDGVKDSLIVDVDKCDDPEVLRTYGFASPVKMVEYRFQLRPHG